IAVLAVIPLIAIALVISSRGAIRIDGTASGIRPFVIAPLLFPVLVLALRASRDAFIFDDLKALVYAIVTGLVIAVILAVVDPKLKEKLPSVAGTVLLSCAYAFGVVTLANELLDRAQPAVFHPVVVKKYVFSGRPTEFRIRLSDLG